MNWRYSFVLMMVLLSHIVCTDDDEIYRPMGSDDNDSEFTEEMHRRPYNPMKDDDSEIHSPAREDSDVNALSRSSMRARDEHVERFKPVISQMEEEGESMQEIDKFSPVNKSDYRTVERLNPLPSSVELTGQIELTPRNKDLPELECYECAYTLETPQKSCLDPVLHRVHTTICNSVEVCYTSIIYSSRKMLPMRVSRGCRSRCTGTIDTNCCETNLCNGAPVKQQFEMSHVLTSKSDKTIPPNVLFFVTILLLLQTVVKVSIA